MFIKKYLYLGLLLCFLTPILGAQTPETAEAFYKTGDFQAAQKNYEGLLQQHPNRADLWFNLGNTHYRLGHKGKAIVSYLKSQALHPRDKDLDGNLALVRSQVVGYAPKKSWNKVTLPEWSLGLLACLTVMNVMVVLRRKGKLTGELAHNLFYVGSILTVIVVLAWGYTSYQIFYGIKGVVIENEVALKSGPDGSMTSLTALGEGTELRVLEKNKGWVKVELANGGVGWIAAASIELL